MKTEMKTDIYERLADALDALPAGFTRTPSKVEIKLIKMVFTPDEALVASTLTRTLETAAEIAKRVGLPEAEVTVLLEGMIPKAMVRADMVAFQSGVAGLGKVEVSAGQKPTAESVKKYRLQSFLVGWYEAYLKNIKPETKEFAGLFEQYVREGGGERILSPRPGVQGVVPMRGSLTPEQLKREPYNDMDAHFQRHERFLVIDCVCKHEKAALHGHSCNLPTRRCGFVGLPPTTPLSENVLSREEAMKLWAEFDALGTMITTGVYGFTYTAETPQFVGCCHCCGCCCGLLNPPRHDPNLKVTGAQPSNYRAVKDEDKCHACGECVRRCQVFAHTFDKAIDRMPVYHRDLCVGCGSCGMGCPSGALHLEPVSEEEWYHVPSNFTEWEERRLKFLSSQNWRVAGESMTQNDAHK
jgi:Na+-translocating ferredoxin:NAD+ oxidoreductase subunit B